MGWWHAATRSRWPRTRRSAGARSSGSCPAAGTSPARTSARTAARQPIKESECRRQESGGWAAPFLLTPVSCLLSPRKRGIVSMIENSILKKNRQGLKALVLALTWPSTEAIELAARVGFDAVNLDGEHGAFTSDTIEQIVRVAHGYGMSVTARVPSSDPWQINLWLDLGLQGILGPHIETGAEAQALADACLFPPDGKRSWGGGRGTLYNEDAELNVRHGGKLGFAQWTNANMIVSAQMESKKA